MRISIENQIQCECHSICRQEEKYLLTDHGTLRRDKAAQNLQMVGALCPPYSPLVHRSIQIFYRLEQLLAALLHIA